MISDALGPESFTQCMEDRIQDLYRKGKNSSAETFQGVLSRILQYHGDEDLYSDRIDAHWVQGFYDYLEGKALSVNTIRTYINITYLVYRFNMTGESRDDPFEKRHYQRKYRKQKTLVAMDLCKMERVDVGLFGYLEQSRNLFLFSHYSGGMSFRDMAFLKKSDIQRGEIHYIRSRSKKPIKVAISDSMYLIMQKYACGGPYVFPILLHPESDLYVQYRAGLRKYHIHLKKLAACWAKGCNRPYSGDFTF
jgi:integrase/recombinase XerD